MSGKRTKRGTKIERNIEQVKSMLDAGKPYDQIWKALKLSSGEVRGAMAAFEHTAAKQSTDQTRQVVDTPIVRSAALRYLLLKGVVAIPDLANHLGSTEKDARVVAEALHQEGYNVAIKGKTVKVERSLPPRTKWHIDVGKMLDRTWRFGLVSDSHLASNHERVDVLEAAYDIFAADGKIDTVFHCGNIVDGATIPRINLYDLKVHGVESQILYCLDNYPQREGITTQYITADDHEGWWTQKVGLNFGRLLELEAKEAGRDDLRWIGHAEVDIQIDKRSDRSFMRLFHPGGGTAYAISYQPQKIAESLQGGEKPQVLLIGHYHKQGYFYPREIHTVLAGCTADQSRFMRKKRIDAHLGFWIIEVTTSTKGAVSRVGTEFFPFYDRTYYTNKDDRWLKASRLLS